MAEFRQVQGKDVLRRGLVTQPLWWQGADLPATPLRVAIVGSRVATPEQLEVAQILARQLSFLGVVTVSGGALGIDTRALIGALEGPVPPLAVLPTGFLAPFPKQNIPLFQEIVQKGGALLSRSQPDDAHSRGRFHLRNDLLVKTVDAVIAVCAQKPSGTLHCARSAWNARVPVLAVPWSVQTANCEGIHALLAAGARAIVPGEPLETLVRDLLSKPLALLQRDDKLPLFRPVEAAPHAAGTPAAPASARNNIDAAGTAWPCYASRPPVPAGKDADPAGISPKLLARLRAALAEAGELGMTAAELASAVGEAPEAHAAAYAEVAAALLEWTLHGGVKRVAGSWYVLN